MHKIEFKEVGICGHFCFNKPVLNGQTIKTKIVTDELKTLLGEENIFCVDTYNWRKNCFFLLINIIKMFFCCKNIIIFPAQNGVKVFPVLFSFINILFRRRMHYCVIGGWLPSYLNKYPWLILVMKNFHSIYVETLAVKNRLVKFQLKNIVVMPNFKNIKMISADQVRFNAEIPHSLCICSRVMKEKGIEDAILAVKEINDKHNKTVFTLDIYGQVDHNYKLRFNDLQIKFPKYIQYCGEISYEQTVDILKKYYVLLFPTHFQTEGIPGTILDAYAAALPVICARWESFNEVVEEGVTGYGYPIGDQMQFVHILETLNPEHVYHMKKKCLEKYEEFIPSAAIEILHNRLKS